MRMSGGREARTVRSRSSGRSARRRWAVVVEAEAEEEAILVVLRGGLDEQCA